MALTSLVKSATHDVSSERGKSGRSVTKQPLTSLSARRADKSACATVISSPLLCSSSQIGGGFGAFVSQFWPDCPPIIWTQLLACDLPACRLFNGDTENRRNWPSFIHPLIYKAGCGSNGLGERYLRVPVCVFL